MWKEKEKDEPEADETPHTSATTTARTSTRRVIVVAGGRKRRWLSGVVLFAFGFLVFWFLSQRPKPKRSAMNGEKREKSGPIRETKKSC